MTVAPTVGDGQQLRRPRRRRRRRRRGRRPPVPPARRPIAGITYYGAYRIVDGNSAVNASSASTSVTDYSATDGTPLTNAGYLGFFRSNVGLQELLSPYVTANPSKEIANLNTFKFGNAGGSFPLKPYAVNPTSKVIEADGDFAWFSVGDALENQLARRPGDPGYTDTAGDTFKWAGLADTAALAHRFTIQDTGSGGSTLEHALFYDLTTGEDGNAGSTAIPTTPFPLTTTGVVQLVQQSVRL